MAIAEERKVYDNIYPYVLSVPSYVKNQRDDVDFKLITILKKGIDIITSPLSMDILIHKDEEFIFDSVKSISEYITNRPPTMANTNYLYDLLLRFFDFCDKKIQYESNMISKENFNRIFDEYYRILLSQEHTFIYSILNEEDKDSFDDFIFNHLTEESLIEVEEKENDTMSADEFLDEMKKW